MVGPGHMALVGPTASGKSALALALARAPGGVELVSVDSMCVYRHMDIGTAKPTAAQRAEVPYHLVDLVDPSEEFTLERFQAEAHQAVAGIGSGGNRALLVGGTGLYLRAVVDGLALPGRFPEVGGGARARGGRPGRHRTAARPAGRARPRRRRPGWSRPTAAGSCAPSR